MKIFKYISYSFFVLLTLISVMPVFSYAQVTSDPAKLDYSGFVKCDGVVLKDANGNAIEPERNRVCDFNALMLTIKSAINWLFIITIPVATVMFAYAGLLYMSGKEKNISKAHEIFASVARGFIIMLIAWFAVVTVVGWFVSDENKKVINTFVNTGK